MGNPQGPSSSTIAHTLPTQYRILDMTDASIINLTLSPDNPVNCTLVNDEGKTLYTIITEFQPKNTFTTVRNEGNEVIASLQWRDSLPDRVTLGNAKPISLGDWMKRSLIPFKDDLSFSDDQGRRYKWKGNSPGRNLELYSEEDKYKEPIAAFYKRRRITNPEDPKGEPIRTAAKLVLTQRAVELQDIVVTSFLFLEKSRRSNERTSQNFADVMAAPISVIGQDYKGRDQGIGI